MVKMSDKAEIERKVYVLGAGASKGAGFPLMSTFFDKAEELRDHGIRRYDNVKEYIKAHKLKHFNIEEIFGYLDMKISLKDSNSVEENRNKDMFLEFIEDVMILSYIHGNKEKKSEYSILLKKFVDNLRENDAIISFNYDVLIDKFLTDNKKYPDYGIDLEEYEKPRESEKRIALLKLHGSLNWRICPTCKNRPRWVGYNSLLDRHPYKIAEIAHIHKRRFIPEETFFVPPSWNKNDYFNKDLWRLASEKLRNADKIIFIGYSLPQTDMYFKYLLLSSLSHNGFVEVVDPNIDNVAGRYLQIFKDRISFKRMSFEEYIASQDNCQHKL